MTSPQDEEQRKSTPESTPRVQPPAPTGDNSDLIWTELHSLRGKVDDVTVRLTRVETKIDGFPALFATKADVQEAAKDLHKAMNAQTWKFIGTVVTLGIVLTAGVYFIAH